MAHIGGVFMTTTICNSCRFVIHVDLLFASCDLIVVIFITINSVFEK